MTESTPLQERLAGFMAAEVYPNERVYAEQLRSAPTPWSQPSVMEELPTTRRPQGAAS